MKIQARNRLNGTVVDAVQGGAFRRPDAFGGVPIQLTGASASEVALAVTRDL